MPSSIFAKERKLSGLLAKNLTLSPKTLEHIIRDYTREAGVRNLERKIATICRKAARRIVEKKIEKVSVGVANLKEFLGPAVYLESDMKAKAAIGVCTGLAWTSVGGELLKIEVVVCEGKGKLVLTGQLGDVMKESAQTAFTYIRSRAKELGLEPDFNEKSTSTSMSRKALSRKMVRLQALRWQRPWNRLLPNERSRRTLP